MRRFLGLTLGILFLSSCSEVTNPSILDTPLPDGFSLISASDIFDGTSDEPGANPHFFFLPPMAPTTPAFSGPTDEGVNPTVTVCPVPSWEYGTESCGEPLATFGPQPDEFGNTVTKSPGIKYSVKWSTSEYPVKLGEVYRVAVSVGPKVLGWADIRAYGRQLVCDEEGNCSVQTLSKEDAGGFVTLSVDGQQKIDFRIEEGALESEYCDVSSLEDCDVELFAYDEAGCLRVFENPGQTGEALGSQACVPANAAEIDGVPFEGIYAVILTLEKAQVAQGGDVPASAQVPFFPDLKTDPAGIAFSETSDGVGVVICQPGEGPGSIPEELHSQLRPFLVYPDGKTVLPSRTDYSFGAPECEAYGAHGHAVASGGSEQGLLRRLAAGVSKASSFFLPRPLNARRLHGGLNTTVYDTRKGEGDDGPGGDGPDASPGQVPGIQMAEEEFVVELGSLLDVDPASSVASVPENGQVGVETTISINALNAQGLPFPFEVPVSVSVVSGADVIDGTVTFEGGGVYSATYTPTTPGTDLITISIDGQNITGSPFTSLVAPLEGDLIVVVDIAGGAPADRLPVYLYVGSDAGSLQTGVTDADGKVTFTSLDFGSYTIHLPKRDFDVEFTTMTQMVDHQSDGQTATFSGTTLDLGSGVRVFRVREQEGTGNAYQYMVGGRSWNSAQNQVQSDYLMGVQGHLVDILSQEENDFVRDFFVSDPNLCPDETNPKKCEYQGWIGLSDDAVEGTFQWTTGVPALFFNWPDGQTAGDQPRDQKGNLDHVEIGLTGIWGIINGASSNNEGYFVEWDVVWPGTPPF